MEILRDAYRTVQSKSLAERQFYILFQDGRVRSTLCECESVCDLFADLLIRYCAIEMNKLLFLCSDC